MVFGMVAMIFVNHATDKLLGVLYDGNDLSLKYVLF